MDQHLERSCYRHDDKLVWHDVMMSMSHAHYSHSSKSGFFSSRRFLSHHSSPTDPRTTKSYPTFPPPATTGASTPLLFMGANTG